MPDYAVYGIHFYGTARYGLPPRFEFSLDYFEALPQQYDRIKVEWGHPSGAYDRMRLVRGNYGFPMDQTEGRLLLEVVNPTLDPGSYEDVQVTPLRFHYYSMFLRQTVSGDWVRAGNAVCLLPKNYGYTERLYELTPGVFRDDDIYISTFTGQGMLQSYMGLFGYKLDQLRSELESLLWTANPERMSVGLLPYLAQQLGFPYEAELGGTLARRQLLYAVYLYKMKGTKLGIEGAVKVLTGWTPRTVVGTTNMLTADQASMETSITGLASAATPVNVLLSRSNTQAADGAWSLRMQATSGYTSPRFTTATAASGLTGIPAIAGGVYSGMAAFRASSTSRQVSVGIQWWRADGSSISTTNGTTVADNSTGWVWAFVTGVVAPADTAYMSLLGGPDAVVDGEVHYADKLALGAGTFTTWELPPGTTSPFQLLLNAERINRVINPSAETNATGWTSTNGSSPGQDATQYLYGTKSFRITAVGGDMSMATAVVDRMPVTAGRVYTASIYSFNPSGTPRAVNVGIRWYNNSNGQIGTDVVGADITQALGVWTNRPYVTAVAPVGAVRAGMVVTVKAAGAAEFQYFDGALFEQGVLAAYFDGSTPLAGTSVADYLWEGTVHLSPSHYYHRRAVVNSRLVTRLPDFLPAGTTFTPRYAQPL